MNFAFSHQWPQPGLNFMELFEEGSVNPCGGRSASNETE
jgi:hypothetical protein